MEGWIKIHRKFEKWGWGDKPEMVSLFLHLLLAASYEDKEWHGEVVQRGQVIFGLNVWAKKTGISVRSLRTCIERLKSTNEVTTKTTSKYTLITIVKYNDYQIDESKTTSISTSISTNDRQAIDKQSTTSKEVKNIRKKEKNTYTSEFETFWQMYPRKDGSKSKSFELYNKSIDLTVTPAIILTGVEAYIKNIQTNKTEPRYVAHAATWLSQRRWEANYQTSQTDGWSNPMGQKGWK